MNREQRKYFIDRLDSELDKALMELHARTEKKLSQLPSRYEALARIMAEPQVRKAVCDALEAFLSEQQQITPPHATVSIYFKNPYSEGCKNVLGLSARIPEIQAVLDERDNSMKRIQDEKTAIRTKLYEAKLALKDQIMFGDDAEKLLGQLTEFRNTITELVNNF